MHDTKVCSWHLVFCSTLQPLVYERGIDGLSQMQIQGLVMTEAASISFYRLDAPLLSERCRRRYDVENELLVLTLVDNDLFFALLLILESLVLLDNRPET